MCCVYWHITWHLSFMSKASRSSYIKQKTNSNTIVTWLLLLSMNSHIFELLTKKLHFWQNDKIVLWRGKFNQAFLIDFPLEVQLIHQFENNHRLQFSDTRLLSADYCWQQGKSWLHSHITIFDKTKGKFGIFYIQNWHHCIDDSTAVLCSRKWELHQAYGLLPLFYGHGWLGNYTAGAFHADYAWLYTFYFRLSFLCKYANKTRKQRFSGTPIPVKMQKFSVSTSHYAK